MLTCVPTRGIFAAERLAMAAKRARKPHRFTSAEARKAGAKGHQFTSEEAKAAVRAREAKRGRERGTT